MTDDPDVEQQQTPADDDAAGRDDDAVLAAYDLDGDGKVSVIEDARATLGVVDARLEELAKEPGVKGKLAEAAHEVLDKFDND